MLPEQCGVELRGRRRRGSLPKQKKILACLRSHCVENLLPDWWPSVAGVTFEHRQRGGDGYVMADECGDQVLRLGTIGFHARQSFSAGTLAANVGLFIGIKLRVYKEAVFEVIDAEFSGFFVGDGAEVASYFQPTFVSGSNRGLQFSARDVHVRLERRYATLGPIVHGLARIFWTGEMRHLEKITLAAFQVRPGHINMRARQFARIDIALQVQIGVRFDAARCAHGGDACRKIKSRGGEGHLRNDDGIIEMPLAVEIRPRYIEEMIVHSIQAWPYCVTVQIQDGCARRRGHVCTLLDAGNLSGLNDDVLIFDCRASGAVDNPCVRKNNFGSTYADELLHRFREFGGLSLHGAGKK